MHGRARVAALYVSVASGAGSTAARSCSCPCLRSNSCCPTAASATVTRDPCLPSLHFALHGTVPMVLDRVVCPTWQVLSYFGPLVTKFCMLFDQGLILIVCPVTSFDVWIKVVVPSALRRKGQSSLLNV